MKKALILDGYIDEPACFGVPPYVSPYIRYLAGVLCEREYAVSYCTCDQWRQGTAPERIGSSDLTIVVAGMTVPGRYRGGTPLSLKELREMAALPRKGLFMLTGPILNGYTLRGGAKAIMLDLPEVDCLLPGNPEVSLAHFLDTGEIRTGLPRDNRRLACWARAGADIVRQHPWFPWIMAEIELSKGCDRQNGHCSFCTEGRGSLYEERDVDQAVSEVTALYRCGVRAFRFGRCANILAYGGEYTARGRRPRADALERLYRDIRNSCPELKVLHTDNANPLTIVRFPEESARAIEVIAKWNTPGDVLSLGLENLDPQVMKLNNLKVSCEEALTAVRIINQAGGRRKRNRHLPAVLPGLNFLFGLAGESRYSLEVNRDFLTRLLEEGLSVRRINIRRAIVHPGSSLEKLLSQAPSRLRDRDYRRWKRWVREEVDTAMMNRVAPTGTIIRNVMIEEKKGNINFGRPLGSYPPLIGIPGQSRRIGEIVDVAVTGHGGRSLTGVPFPLREGDMNPETLTAIPGIGKARARRLMEGHPSTLREALSHLDDPELIGQLELFCDPGHDAAHESRDSC